MQTPTIFLKSDVNRKKLNSMLMKKLANGIIEDSITKLDYNLHSAAMAGGTNSNEKK